MTAKIINYTDTLEAITAAKTLMSHLGDNPSLTDSIYYKKMLAAMLKDERYRDILNKYVHDESDAQMLYENPLNNWTMDSAYNYALAREHTALMTEIFSEANLTIDFYVKDGILHSFIRPGARYLQQDNLHQRNAENDSAVPDEWEEIATILAHLLDSEKKHFLFQFMNHNNFRYILTRLISAEHMAFFKYAKHGGYCDYSDAQYVVDARARAATAIEFFTEKKLVLDCSPFQRCENNCGFIPNRSKIDYNEFMEGFMHIPAWI